MQSPTAQTINSVIDKLADKLSIPAAQIWAALMERPRAALAGDSILVAFVLLVWFGWLRGWWAKKYGDEYKYEDVKMGRGFATALFMVFVLITVSCVTCDVQNALSPHYYAAQQILDAVRGK